MSNKELIRKILEDITMRINSQSVGYRKHSKGKLNISPQKNDMEPKRVVTEKDILNLVGTERELIISIGTIITPLAKDTARENKIKIIFQ